MLEVVSVTEDVSSESSVSTAAPIFILGVMPRSGTHYLSNLICLHTDCQKSVPDEDFLLSYSDYLTKFANSLQNQWELMGSVKDPNIKDLLMECLGEGLILFLHMSRKKALETRAGEFNFDLPQECFTKRIVVKTPFIDNLHKFFRLFPNAHLLILVRDGRAVVESNVRSFHPDSESITRDWALSIDRILRFDRNAENAKHKYMIIRYEDLFSDTENQLRKVLNFLGLDADRYDFVAAANAPVVGSSTFKRDKTVEMDWSKMKKTEDFNPLARADDWTRAQHERFNWLASEQLIAFGYEPKTYSGNKFFWILWNKALDFKWSCKVWLRRIKKGFLFVARRLKAYKSNPTI